ncbi:MAG: MFS transporter [Chloroflexota bacterium]
MEPAALYNGIVRPFYEKAMTMDTRSASLRESEDPPFERAGRAPMAASQSPSRGHPAHQLFRNRDFALLWSGQLLSMIGDQCLIVAGITLIAELSQSPLALLIPALSIVAPQVIFGLMGGVIADRLNRKLVMVVCDLARALIVLPILFVSGLQQIWILYAAAVGLALAGVCFGPARNASLPKIVPSESLMTANGLIQGSHVIALIVGPTIGGLAVQLWQPSAILFRSVTFLVSAIAVSLMRIPPNGRGKAVDGEEPGFWNHITEGLSFVRHSDVLRRVLAVTAVAAVGAGAVMLLAIPHLKAKLGGGGLEYGFAISVLGLGSLLGGILATRIAKGVSTSTLVGGMLFVGGVAIVAFAYAPSYVVVLISVALMGMCLVVARGALDAVTQTVAPDDIRGRVQSAVNLLVMAATGISAGLSAAVGSVVQTETVFLAAGLMTALIGLVAVFALRDAAQVLSPAAAEAPDTRRRSRWAARGSDVLS